jgi:hypothetical protein
MSLLTKTRASQHVEALVFTFNFDDTMVPKAGGAAVDFGKTNTSATIFEIAALPAGARVVGGSFERLVAFDTASYTVTLGDAGDVDRYLASADLKALGTTPLLLLAEAVTPQATSPVEFAVTNADVCTTGQGRITILFVVDGRGNEIYTH